MTTATITPSPGPVRAPVRVVDVSDHGRTVCTEVEVTADEPVFAGHYPGFPIFPGVCVLDCVHRSALLGAPEVRRLELVAVERFRFTGAVYPGDLLSSELRWTESGGQWLVTATVRCGDRSAATGRLRYRPGGEA